MEDKKISGLPDADLPLNDADLFEVVQGGVNKKAPKSAVGGGGAVDSVNGQTGVVVLDAGDVGADPAGSASTVNTALSNHISDATDAHAATAITNTPAGNISATTVQAAINELDTEKAPLASPALTGAPTAPTAAQYTATTQVATTAFVQSKIDAHLTIKTKTASHTLDSNDLADVNLGKALNFIMDVAAPNDFTIVQNSTLAFPIGTQFLVDYTNTGATSFIAGSGVTIQSADGLTIAARYKGVVAKKIATNTWLLQGALTT